MIVRAFPHNTEHHGCGGVEHNNDHHPSEGVQGKGFDNECGDKNGDDRREGHSQGRFSLIGIRFDEFIGGSGHQEST